MVGDVVKNMKKRKYPAVGKTCLKCKKKYHFAVVWGTKSDRKVRVHEIDQDDDMFVGSLSKSDRKRVQKHDKFKETLTVCNKNSDFQIDTGAKCNAISKADFRKLGKKLSSRTQKPNVALKSFSGHKLIPISVVACEVMYKGISYKTSSILWRLSPSQLSAEKLQETGLIKCLYQIETDYGELFQG